VESEPNSRSWAKCEQLRSQRVEQRDIGSLMGGYPLS